MVRLDTVIVLAWAGRLRFAFDLGECRNALWFQSAHHWPGGSGVHVLEQRQRFMLVSLCHKVLAAILAEPASVDPDTLARLDRASLLNRGYCRHCVDALWTSAPG
jgi:hypothetical protein